MKVYSVHHVKDGAHSQACHTLIGKFKCDPNQREHLAPALQLTPYSLRSGVC